MLGLFGKVVAALFLAAFALVAALGDAEARKGIVVPAVIFSAGFGLFWLAQRQRKIQAAEMAAKLRDEHVPSMSPLDYERFTALLLERAGWTVKHIGTTGDQGCDVLAEFVGEYSTVRAVIQCKLYTKRCGNAAVQEIAAARRHYDAHVMAVVCPAGYTEAAKALARTNGVHLLHHNDLPSLAAVAKLR